MSERERAALLTSDDLRPISSLAAERGLIPAVYGTDLDPAGYSLPKAIESHVQRPVHKSHPHHCAHCYYPWPCPTVVLYRALLTQGASDV